MLTHLHQMHEMGNILTRWSIQIQYVDFIVKRVLGKLNVVPNGLSRLFDHTNGESILSELEWAAICLSDLDYWQL